MINKLIEKIQKTHAPIVVGLDPMLNYVPEHIQKRAFAEYGETLEGAAEAISLQVHVVFSFQVMYTHFKQQILSPGEVIRYVFVRVSEDSHVPNIPSFSRYFYRFRKDSYDSGYYPTSSL